jgi:hypothetical protein
MVRARLAFSLSGVIADDASGRPIKGIRVRVFDKELFRDQLLGEGRTDDKGRYTVRFGAEGFTGPHRERERSSDLFVQLYDTDDRLIYTSERSVVVDAGRHTTLDIRVPYFARPGAGPVTTPLFGVAVNLGEVARLSSSEVLSAYRLMRNPNLVIESAERIMHAFPGIFAPQPAPPECGNGIHEMFRYLMKERDALADLDDLDTDPYLGATVRQFFTASIVVKYTTDATLPGGAVNPNRLPPASATVPTADAAYNMPNGTVIGTVRANLADLDPANTEVAPTYIQKVGLLAEYALSRFIAAPFSYLDPRGGLARLEFRVLGLPAGVAGYAVPSDFHMELNTSNSDSQNLGTVPHELFHLVQFRYNAGSGPANGIRWSVMEGGARLLEESINETPNRYVASAVDGDLSMAPVPRKGIFTFPEESLVDVGGGQSLLRYAAGLLWKFIAEQHSTLTGATDEPAIGVDAYRAIIEQMTPTADGFTITALRNGRARLPWYGSFDQFSYYDAAASELGSHETTWANFLAANYFHRLLTPASTGFDARFDYQEDEDPPGLVNQLDTFGPAVAPGNTVPVAQGTAVTRNVVGHKPYAAVYYELIPDAASAPRMVQVRFAASGGMSDPLVQIIRIGAGNSLVDIHRSDRTSYAKTINLAGLTKVVVIVASRATGGDFTLNIDEVPSATDVMVTRWNTRVGTEYEADPRGWSWTWISPDLMVDNDDDLLEDTSVFFGHNNKLKVRLRNRGNAAASNIQVSFWYQKATPFLTTSAWIPVQNLAGVTQQLAGLTLAAGAESWFAVDWCPVDDGTHHPHWCVKVQVSCPGDPNLDNKMAFRNFSHAVVGSPDSSVSTLVRYLEWTEADRLLVVPRGPRWTLELGNREDFPVSPAASRDRGTATDRVTLGVPTELSFARFQAVASELPEWDGKITLEPSASRTHYPIDERTLPPGVDPTQLVTVAHVRDGQPFGGISFRLVSEYAST